MDRNEPLNPATSTPATTTGCDASSDIAAPDPLDEAVLQLAAQAAFLQAFAETLIEEEERPVEEVLMQRGAGGTDFGWRAASQW